MQNKQGASVNVCVTRLRLSQQSSRFKRLPLAAAGTPTLLSSRWRIYCNQTLIGNRVLRALGDKALPSGRTHTKITRYARNLQTHTRRLRGANQSRSPATLKFHSRKTSQYASNSSRIGETCEFTAIGKKNKFYNTRTKYTGGIDRYGEKWYFNGYKKDIPNNKISFCHNWAPKAPKKNICAHSPVIIISRESYVNVNNTVAFIADLRRKNCWLRDFITMRSTLINNCDTIVKKTY